MRILVIVMATRAQLQAPCEQRSTRSQRSPVLKSGDVFPPEAQSLLADLLERRQLTKKSGRRRRPSYESSPEETRLEKAAYFVRERQRQGEKFEAALDEVADRKVI
jgi:hypothetical protein